MSDSVGVPAGRKVLVDAVLLSRLQGYADVVAPFIRAAPHARADRAAIGALLTAGPQMDRGKSLMKIAFRHPEAPTKDWTEYVEWPESWRVPAVGESVDLVKGQFRVKDVQWFPRIEGYEYETRVQVIV